MSAAPSSPGIDTSEDFATAARSVLAFVRAELELDMALVCRRVDTHAVVLAADDARWNTRAGDVLAWDDALCSRAVAGSVPWRHAADARSYVAVPIRDSAGEVIGTLCGAGAEAKGEEFAAKLPVVQLLGDLLGTLLQRERDLATAVRAADRARAFAHSDPLTGVGNRRHWNAMLATEAERFSRYANPYALVVFDLDDVHVVNDRHGLVAGDELICLTAEILTALVRPSDTVARLGGDEFGILAVECDRDGASALTARLSNAFAFAGIGVSIGVAVSKPGQDGRATWAAADAALTASRWTLGPLVGQA